MWSQMVIILLEGYLIEHIILKTRSLDRTSPQKQNIITKKVKNKHTNQPNKSIEPRNNKQLSNDQVN